MNIDSWLIEFKKSWEDKNVDNVIKLFDDNVIYYETPFKRLDSLNLLKKEWEAIIAQNEINLVYNIFSKDDNKYTVQWKLKYIDKNQKDQHYKGIYLIKLNHMGLCSEFWHYCESE